MIITDSSLSLSSQHLAINRYQKKESLKTWTGSQRPDFEGTAKHGKQSVDTVTLSGQRAALYSPNTAATNQSDPAADPLDPKIALLQNLIEMITGKKISIAELKKMIAPPVRAGSNAQATPESAQPGLVTPESPQSTQSPKAGYGVEYDSRETRYEFEKTSFSASGVIKTADGREIGFNLDLAMKREYLSETNVSLRAGDAVKKDPLVINFNGMAAELTDTKFNFDIDADGASEKVASLGAGSGYLAIDKNQDGTVNSGAELFGAKTGNGFTELAAYDQNRDGWIDEQDAVFSQLKVWQGGSGGLTSLKDAGVGAINLASQQTPFALKDSNNQLLGDVKATGIYVKENGTVGTVQQLDLAV